MSTKTYVTGNNLVLHKALLVGLTVSVVKAIKLFGWCVSVDMVQTLDWAFVKSQDPGK